MLAPDAGLLVMNSPWMQVDKESKERNTRCLHGNLISLSFLLNSILWSPPWIGLDAVLRCSAVRFSSTCPTRTTKNQETEKFVGWPGDSTTSI